MPADNVIINAAQPVLDFLVGFSRRSSKDGDVSLDSVRRRLMDMIREAMAQMEKEPGMGLKMETVRYVLAALADETLIFSDWPHAEDWKRNSLEKAIFNTNVAGERFFELLEKEGFFDPRLAELFYICLCLGFGRKRTDAPGLKHKLYMMISSRMPDDERHLSPAARQAVRVPESRFPPMFGLWSLVILAGVAVVFYFIAGQWVWNEVAEQAREVSEYLKSI
jgi:type IV/VI secretion system ImpK/VasF family protein